MQPLPLAKDFENFMVLTDLGPAVVAAYAPQHHRLVHILRRYLLGLSALGDWSSHLVHNRYQMSYNPREDMTWNGGLLERT